MAQLVARSLDMGEVTGSSPVQTTNFFSVLILIELIVVAFKLAYLPVEASFV